MYIVVEGLENVLDRENRIFLIINVKLIVYYLHNYSNINKLNVMSSFMNECFTLVLCIHIVPFPKTTIVYYSLMINNFCEIIISFVNDCSFLWEINFQIYNIILKLWKHIMNLNKLCEYALQTTQIMRM